MRADRWQNWATDVQVFLAYVFSGTPHRIHVFGSMLYGLDMMDSDLDVCVEVPCQPPSLTEWVTEKFPDLLQSSGCVEEVKLCEWKRTVEMKFRGRWCDIMFSMSAQTETAVRESRSLMVALEQCTVAQRSAINLLVAWAKHSGLAKTKEDGLSVRRVGFKGIHWAWMGISALLYCEQCGGKSLFDANVADRNEPLHWLFYFARFLAHFPWKDVALDPNGGTPLKLRQGLNFKEEA